VADFVADLRQQDGAAPAAFELAEATPTSTGALIATYRPARQPA
jgi:hypothetical protein